MKTSMAYRLYRLYFNSNADNHQLFGNRVHNPINGALDTNGQLKPALIRGALIVAVLASLVAIVAS